MASKRSIHSVQNDGEEKLLVPPGFVSLTSLTLKRTDNSNKGEAADLMAVGGGFKPGLIDAPLSNSFIAKFKNSFNQRPWILHNQFDRAPKKYDSGRTEVDMEHQLRVSLPKGVTQGCSSCPDCLNVSARWHPEESRLPVLDDAPVFHPAEEEFKDTLKYISKLRSTAENYGICRIVPPSWKPSCLLEDIEMSNTSTFTTRVQQIDGLKNFYSKRKLSRLDGRVENKRLKALASMEHNSYIECVTDPEEAYRVFASSNFESRPGHTFQSFKKYADDFKRQYFCMNDDVIDSNVKLIAAQKQEGPLIARIEGEYWRIIETPSEEIEVLYGTNLKSKTLGSGFPTKSHQENEGKYSEYMKSGWNLNNTPMLSGSLLPFGCDSTSSLLVPQLFIGMCFASQCWRNEDHHLYSLSYMHVGDPKVWYGVPGRYCLKFVEVVRKLFPQLSKYPHALRELVYQISPSVFVSEGIPVYRCVQNPLEFVVVFPGAYHAGFHCGFNCSEAVCFAPFDWLPHGLNAVELYSDFCRRNSISYDRLLFGAALEAVRAQWETYVVRNDSMNYQLWKSVCGKEGILTKVLKARVRLEKIRREHLCNLSRLMALDEVGAASKKECSICLCDLYLSAVGCSCSPNVYTCLLHGKRLCSCSWNDQRFLFLYEITDLNSLVEALEGNVKAIHAWAKKKIQPLADSNVVKDTVKKPSPGYKGPPAATVELKYPDISKENEITITTSSFPLPVSSRHNTLRHSESSKNMLPSSGETAVRSPSRQHDIIVLSDDDN